MGKNINHRYTKKHQRLVRSLIRCINQIERECAEMTAAETDSHRPASIIPSVMSPIYDLRKKLGTEQITMRSAGRWLKEEVKEEEVTDDN